MAEPESGIREQVETAVRERLDSLGLKRRMRTRVDLTVEDTR